MQRDINLIIEETKINIVKTINESGLPISVIYYIMRDIMTETSEEYQRQINRAYAKEREQQEQAASAEPINTEEITEIVEDN
jgi:hypothetical protein